MRGPFVFQNLFLSLKTLPSATILPQPYHNCALILETFHADILHVRTDGMV